MKVDPEKIKARDVLDESITISQSIDRWFQKFKYRGIIDPDEKEAFINRIWSAFPGNLERELPECYKIFYAMLEKMLEMENGEYPEDKMIFYTESGIFSAMTDLLWHYCKPDMWRLRIGTRAMLILDAIEEKKVGVKAALGTVTQINGLDRSHKTRISRLLKMYGVELPPAVLFYGFTNGMLSHDEMQLLMNNHDEANDAEYIVPKNKNYMSESVIEYIRCPEECLW